ncbi:MAG: DNA repair protein RadC [Endomicrobium sp.]|jgi:DNA repair protein RadC|nr:DNA repair protein RadC [Endomicrobium sp.]
MLEKKSKPHYLGHRSRLRNRFLETGFKGLADYEILELALTYVIPRKDVKPQSKSLIQEFGSLKQVFDADIKDLKKIKNLSAYSAGFLMFLRKFSSLYLSLRIKQQEKINSSLMAKDFLISSLSGEKIEKVYILTLDSGNRITSYKELESGTVNKSFLMPRKIAETALNNKAASIIIAHNHPGGTLKPSQSDIAATISVRKALESIEVFLLDHIIVSNNDYFSFKEHSLI